MSDELLSEIEARLYECGLKVDARCRVFVEGRQCTRDDAALSIACAVRRVASGELRIISARREDVFVLSFQRVECNPAFEIIDCIGLAEMISSL